MTLLIGACFFVALYSFLRLPNRRRTRHWRRMRREMQRSRTQRRIVVVRR